MPKDYMEVIREVIQDYDGEYKEIIAYAPDIFGLLANVHEDNRITRDHKKALNAAIAYFVHPYDIFPEDVHGAFGYVDDLYLGAYILKMLAGEIDSNIIRDHWMGEGDVMTVIDSILALKEGLVGDKFSEMLDFVGLSPSS